MINIDFNTVVIAPHTGYGNASRYLLEALSEEMDIIEGAPNILNFCMPKDYIMRDFTIGYTPWESTQIPTNWYRQMSAVDDLWTTSNWVAEIFKHQTGRKDVFVLPHGITDNWHPVRHEVSKGPFTFVHVGEPAVRKGGDILLAAWHKHFRYNKDVRLIYKCIGHTMARVKDRDGSIIYSPPMLEQDNGQTISGVYSELEMWRLYVEANCLVYPTRGEGFGLIPLEAMASGLPTILPAHGGTGDFSHYGLALNNSMWVVSGEAEHPGMWMDHDIDELIHLMEYAINNYGTISDIAYHNAWQIKCEFDWQTVARSAVERIKLIK